MKTIHWGIGVGPRQDMQNHILALLHVCTNGSPFSDFIYYCGITSYRKKQVRGNKSCRADQPCGAKRHDPSAVEGRFLSGKISLMSNENYIWRSRRGPNRYIKAQANASYRACDPREALRQACGAGRTRDSASTTLCRLGQRMKKACSV